MALTSNGLDRDFHAQECNRPNGTCAMNSNDPLKRLLGEWHVPPCRPIFQRWVDEGLASRMTGAVRQSFGTPGSRNLLERWGLIIVLLVSLALLFIWAVSPSTSGFSDTGQPYGERVSRRSIGH